MNSFLSYFSWV